MAKAGLAPDCPRYLDVFITVPALHVPVQLTPQPPPLPPDPLVGDWL